MVIQVMIKLPKSSKAWSTAEFETILKKEIESLDAKSLPLQQGLTQTSHVSDEAFGVVILHTSADDESIHVKAGVFYSGIIAGCSCADDPTPLDTINEYCEVQFEIDRQTTETTATLLSTE